MNKPEKRPQGRSTIRFLFSALMWGASTMVWAFVWYTYYGEDIIRPFGYKGNWLVVFVYGLVLLLFSNIYGAYRVGYLKRGDIIFSGILAIIITNGITYLQTSLVVRALIDVMPFVVMTIVDIVIIWMWATAADFTFQKLFPPREMLIVYGVHSSAESLIIKMTSRAEKYRICEVVSVLDGMEEAYAKIDRYDTIILCDIKSDLRNPILKYCYGLGKRVYLTPKISDAIIRGAEPIHLFDTPLLLCKSTGLSLEQRIVKRGFDIIVSGLGLIITAPFMLLTALAIKLQDGGPTIFKQERATINGKTFNIYKFRSMIVDAEKDGKPHPCVDGDSRITPVGNFIRKTRLDELPQLINIFMGDMSIVGPRPERIEHVEMYSEEIPEFAFRLKVKGGLTGYAQIVGRYNTTAYDKLKLDLFYIEHYSFWLDLKIILMTIKVMFMKESTEGFGLNNNIEVQNKEPVDSKKTISTK